MGGALRRRSTDEPGARVADQSDRVPAARESIRRPQTIKQRVSLLKIPSEAELSSSEKLILNLH